MILFFLFFFVIAPLSASESGSTGSAMLPTYLTLKIPRVVAFSQPSLNRPSIP